LRGQIPEIAGPLLEWYDIAARELPWRVGPEAIRAGVKPDPYAVWLSEIMLQQTTVAAVEGYFRVFLGKWPDVAALAAADDANVMAAWAGLGYYARARNLLKCARIIAQKHDGHFPEHREALADLPGIGPYTSAAIAAIAFDKPETVVDGNVERVVARLFGVTTPLPAAKAELARLAARLTCRQRPGDFAQAMMDLGATICTRGRPLCMACPLRNACIARKKGNAAELPRRTPKPAKPVRYGYVYIARRMDGAMLLERRPDRGLLGGMLSWPGGAWGDEPQEAPPIEAIWQRQNGEVRHTFTHFHLRLSVFTAQVPLSAVEGSGSFVPVNEFRPSDLPTVMRKAYDLVSRQLSEV